MLNNLTFVNSCVIDTLNRNITHSALTTRKTTKQMEKLNCGVGEKKNLFWHGFFNNMSAAQ